MSHLWTRLPFQPPSLSPTHRGVPLRWIRVVPHPHLGLTELSVQEGGFRAWGVPHLGLTLAEAFVDDLKLKRAAYEKGEENSPPC